MKIFIGVLFFCYCLFGNDLLKIDSYRAEFIQSVTNSSNNTIIYKGDVVIKQPYYIKWIYKTPIKKYLFIIKKQVTIIEPELEQVIQTKLTKELNILTLIKQAKHIKNNQYISKIYDIDYFLTFQDKKLVQIDYQDELDNHITIKFTNISYNIPIDISEFKFNIPYDYDFISK